LLAALFAVPGSAAAHTWTAWAGSPGKAPAGTPKGAEINLFFPSALRIRQGDSVRFRNNEFHTATFLARGKKAQAPFVPDPSGAKYEGINDAAGNPFYFDGLPKFIYNPSTFAPVGSKTVGDGKEHSAGVFGKALGPKAASVTFKFTKRGQYTVICLIHPGMKGRIIVGGARSAVRGDALVQGQVASEGGKAFASVTKASKLTPPANTIYAGVGDKATLLGYVPNKLTVKAGTSVDFVERSSSEVHNVLFGPKDYSEKFGQDTDLLPFAPGAPNQVTPVDIYGTDPAVNGAYTFDGANHGNGFFVTPVIDDQPGGPLQNTSRITFTKAGTYHYFCAIHGPEMSGDITVTE
jgi:plastocyanin